MSVATPKLDAILADAGEKRRFEAFVRKRLCGENLDFLRDVNEYKSLSSESSRKKRAAQIYNDYIADDAQTAINIPHTTRDPLKAQLNLGKIDLYDRALNDVRRLLEHDCASGIGDADAETSLGLLASPLKLPLTEVDKESNGPTSPRKFFKNLLTPTKMKRGRVKEHKRERRGSEKTPKVALDMKKRTNKKFSPLSKESPSRKGATLSPIAVKIARKVQQSSENASPQQRPDVRSSPRLAALYTTSSSSAKPAHSRLVSSPFWDFNVPCEPSKEMVWMSDEEEELTMRLSSPKGRLKLRLVNQ